MNDECNQDGLRERAFRLAHVREHRRRARREAWASSANKAALARRMHAARMARIRQGKATKPDNTGEA